MQRIQDDIPRPLMTDLDAWLVFLALLVMIVGLTIGIVQTLLTFQALDRITEATRWLTTTTT